MKKNITIIILLIIILILAVVTINKKNTIVEKIVYKQNIKETINKQNDRNKENIKETINNENKSAIFLGLFDKNYISLKDKYKKDENFNNCMIRNTNTCIENFSRKDINAKVDINLCNDFLTEQKRQSCKNNLISLSAIKENSITKCDELKNEEKNSCKKQVIMKIANEKQDIKECDKLKEFKKAETKSKSNKVNSNNIPGLDSNMPGLDMLGLNNTDIVTTCKNRIYQNLAIEKNTIIYCKKINNKIEKEMCIQNLKLIKTNLLPLKAPSPLK